MQIQKSFANHIAGTLYIVPTPIGNLEDITIRALNVLRTVEIIAAEDTRITKKLLNHFDIHTALISYHEHSDLKREEQLLERLSKGESVALVSDAGMPAISDPGSDLVRTAIELDYPIVVLPGANAALCALIGSGISTKEFLFYGFLPRKEREIEEELERLKDSQATLIFYESPYRLKKTLVSLAKVLGDRQISIARELTKKFEEYIRGTIHEVIDWSKKQDLKGEFCLVIEGSSQEKKQKNLLWWSHLSVKDHVLHYVEEKKLSNKEAIKQVAFDRKMKKREVYQIFHIK